MIATCRLCKKPLWLWQEDFTDANGEKYHLECYRKMTGFIQWEWNQKE